MSLLAVEDLRKSYGGVTALAGLSFEVREGTIHSIIGPNGAGKTTLFDLITGLQAPSGGRVVLRGAPVTQLAPHRRAALGISRSFQNLRVFTNMTALENVMVGRHLHARCGFAACLLRLPAASRIDAECRRAGLALLERIGLTEFAEADADALPYGALKRLEIARALATEPALLLLDEPAAGCNESETREIDTLIQQVAADGVTVLLVEHDMRLVMGISDRITVLNHGRLLAQGSAEEVRANPDVVEAYLGRSAAKSR
jgi:branched-chain amino acid transport system ATP-binding protein